MHERHAANTQTKVAIYVPSSALNDMSLPWTQLDLTPKLCKAAMRLSIQVFSSTHSDYVTLATLSLVEKRK